MSVLRGRAVFVMSVWLVGACHGNDQGLPSRPTTLPVPGGSAGAGPVPQGIPTFPGYGGSPADAAPASDGSVAADAQLAVADGGPGDGAPAALGSVPGNPEGACAVPAEGMAEDVSHPTTVVGTGTRESCTADAFVDAVARGGVITFDCGPDPVTITLARTAKVFNDKGPKVVIDGGGKVTLSGGGKVRILYQNTCDQAQVWTTDHCQDQDQPQLTVQNLTFADGNARGQGPNGGGAIMAFGGRLKVVRSRFVGNSCDDGGATIGGGAIHAEGQFQNRPVYIVSSTFGGAPGAGNRCSNGGALNGFTVNYVILNSLLTDNQATGSGSLPPRKGTPGGGSGGAIYTDVGSFALSVCGTKLLDNSANEMGGAIFFNSDTGVLTIQDSLLSHNPSKGTPSPSLPGVHVIGRDPRITNSRLE